MNKRILSVVLIFALLASLCSATLYVDATTITTATNVVELPTETNLLSTLTPTKPDGTAYPTMADSEQPITALADGVLSTDATYRWRGNASSGGRILVYDLQAPATITKFLVGSADGRYVTGVDIYVGNSLTDLCTADNLAVSVSSIGTYHNTFSAADTSFSGQFVAFDFTKTELSWLGNQLRLSELGVYGTRQAVVITESISAVPAKANRLAGIAPVHASGAAVASSTGTTDWLTDGAFSNAAASHEGEWHSSSGPADAVMIYDLGAYYELDSFLLGNGTSRGALAVDIYVGTERDTLLNEEHRVAQITGIVRGGNYHFKRSESVLARYVAFDFSYTMTQVEWTGSGKMIRLSELGAYGAPTAVVVTESISAVPNKTNRLAGIAPVHASGAAVASSTGTTDWLTDGAFSNAATNHEGEWHSSSGPADAVMIYDLGAYYELDSFLLGNGTSRGALAVDIYVGTDRGTLLDEDHRIAQVTDIVRGGNYQFNRSQSILARYVAFDFSYTMTQVEWTGSGKMIRLSELGAYGAPAYAVTNLGGQVRDPENETDHALRFGFSMDCQGITYADTNSYTRNIADDATVTIGNAQVGIADFGAIVSLVEKDAYTLADVDNDTTKMVTAQKLFDVREGSVTFTAVIIKIPSAHIDTPLYACPYVVTTDGTVLYGEVISRSVLQVNGDALS